MGKRSHSDALLDDAAKLLEPKSSAKKQRLSETRPIVTGDDIAKAGTIEHKKERKEKKEKKHQKKAVHGANEESRLTNGNHGPDVVANGAPVGESSAGFEIATAPDERERKKKKKKSKDSTKNESEETADGPASANAHGEIATHKEGEKKDKKEKKHKKKSPPEKTEPSATSAMISPATDDGEPSTAVNGTTQTYQQAAALTNISQANIDNFLTSNFITISDPLSTGYRPITDFAHLPSVNTVSQSVFKDFKSPTPIQAAAWPFLFAGRDAVGVAETGSGKTLAFGLPCMRFVTAHLSEIKKGRGSVKAVVVSPTRELALQIYEQFTKLTSGTQVGVVCIYGGVPKDDQRIALRTTNIIVATPGRLNDFLQEGSADLTNVGYLVLDEADRMLDKGFEEEIRKIISTIPTSKCQTAMFTATWPASIRDLAATFMKNPVRINIGEDNPTGDLRANTRVKQLVEVVDPRGKEFRLLQLLKQYQSGKNKDDRILVFCLYKKEATRVEGFIRSKGFRVAGIHGDLAQSARTAALESFKSGQVPLLVATDVAARGLDIPAVKLVINVTFPLTVEDYVHRIGRTGRAGKEGLAITLFTEHDKAQSGALINVLRAAKQDVPEELLKFGTTVKKKAHEAYGAFYKDTSGETKTATKVVFD